MEDKDLLTPKSILLIGGGTGGHILPLHSLAEELLKQNQKVYLVVNDAKLDRKIVKESFLDLPYSLPLTPYYFKAYKLHYHLAFSNLINWWRILLSIGRAHQLLKTIKPDVIFFKGGFVGFPFLLAAKLFGFKGKIYLHESDISTGALSKLFGKYADRVFSNFGNDALPLFYWPKINRAHRASNLPLPLGEDQGEGSKPQILIFGGSQGAQFINELILSQAEALCQKYKVVLVTGPGKLSSEQQAASHNPNFEAHEFLEADELVRQLHASSLVIARAGASIFQVLAAKKPCIMIPLPTAARNHQQHNAEYFANKGLAYLLEQNDKTDEKLLPMIEEILADKELASKLKRYQTEPAAEAIAKAITS